jgi:SAM-dependent methyltransferase
LYEGVRERPRIEALGLGPVPPPYLRYRVAGLPDLDLFLVVGQRIVADMEAALRGVGRELASFDSVLDFGCGCGRAVRWLRGQQPGPRRIYGTDIDAPAIAWCRKHLGAGYFSTNAGRPPLAFPSGHFDLVYAISVFSHLREDYQRAWREELARVTLPAASFC